MLKKLLEQGKFELARAELASLQTVIGPVLAISDNFFEANQAEKVLEEEATAETLKLKIDTQASIAEEAKPLLEKAEHKLM